MERLSNKISVVMYHYVRDLAHSRYPKIQGLDVSLFRKQLQFFNDNFNVITMEELLSAIKSNFYLPENAALLTFDDGYADNYTFVLPLLEEFKMQGSFFIPGKTFTTHQLLDVNRIHYVLASSDIYKLTDDVKNQMDFYRGDEYNYPSTEELYNKYAIANRFDIEETIFVKRMLQTVLPEKLRNLICKNLFKEYVGISEEKLAYELYMTADQIRTMKRHGMFIGCHGYDHYWLGNLEEKQMQNDIKKGLDCINEFIDRDNWVMVYPYGSHNQAVLKYAESIGANAGFSVDVRCANLREDNPLLLPRFDCNDFPPKSLEYIKFL